MTGCVCVVCWEWACDWVCLCGVSLSHPCAVGQGGSGRKAPQVEMGTQGKDEVDYNWLPPSTLAAQS